jgi:hypothetical protein
MPRAVHKIFVQFPTANHAVSTHCQTFLQGMFSNKLESLASNLLPEKEKKGKNHASAFIFSHNRKR